MATKIEINKISNCNIYINGANMLGSAEEVDLPDIKHKFQEHESLGMIGVAEFWSGIDKMEARIKWKSYGDRHIFENANPFKPVNIQVKMSRDLYVNGALEDEVPVTAYFTCSYKDFMGLKLKAKEIATYESNLAVYYYKLEVDGIVVTEIDILNNIMNVDGDDLLANYRANLGV